MLGDGLAHSPGQSSVQTSKGLAHETGKTIFFFFMALLCSRVHCHVQTGKGQTQTAATKLEAHYCLKYHCVLQL